KRPTPERLAGLSGRKRVYAATADSRDLGAERPHACRGGAVQALETLVRDRRCADDGHRTPPAMVPRLSSRRHSQPAGGPILGGAPPPRAASRGPDVGSPARAP